LACDISPSDENAPGAHGISFFGTRARDATSHQSLAAFVSPGHDVLDGVCAIRGGGAVCRGRASFGEETIKQSDEIDFEELDEVIVAAVADKSTLITNGFKVNLGP
jgi:hypothetical protein